MVSVSYSFKSQTLRKEPKHLLYIVFPNDIKLEQKEDQNSCETMFFWS